MPLALSPQVLSPDAVGVSLRDPPLLV